MAKFAIALQFRNGVRIRLVAVDIDDAWTNPGVAAQRQLQNQQPRHASAITGNR
jgi:hypothetical protein